MTFQHYLGLTTLVLALSVPGPTAAASLGTNLIVNGNAEAGPGGNGNVVIVPPGFSTNGDFTVVTYSTGSGFPTLNSPGPADRGNNFFAGGPGGYSNANQSIDVSNLFSLIDHSAIHYDLSAYLGGFGYQDDQASLIATFLSSSNASLASVTVGPVTGNDRQGVTGFLFRSDAGTVPIGTRQISIVLFMNEVAAVYNDAYADNLSLILSSVPEPATWLLFAIGACVISAGYMRMSVHRGGLDA